MTVMSYWHNNGSGLSREPLPMYRIDTNLDTPMLDAPTV